MNTTHRKTLIAIFTDPVAKSVEWRRIEEAKPYQVRDARQFLENLGVKP